METTKIAPLDDAYKVIYDVFTQSLIRGDRAKCIELTRFFLDGGFSVNMLYEYVFRDSLYKVGDLWEQNKISIATEHLATAIIEAILNDLYSEFSFEKNKGKSVLLACLENELHQVGIKMVGDVFEQNGWEAYFLGANTPVVDLLLFAKDINPDVIALSLSLYSNFLVFNNFIEKFRDEFQETPLIIGGQAFRYAGVEIIEKYDNVKLLSDLPEIEEYINTYN